MTKPCAVPTCKMGNRGDKSNRSVFHVPKDVERLRQWVAAIPGIVKLKPTHVIYVTSISKTSILFVNGSNKMGAVASLHRPHISIRSLVSLLYQQNCYTMPQTLKSLTRWPNRGVFTFSGLCYQLCTL
ncbi:uncharacterized protein LOC143899742 isoform X1 [Temnothorax americanus]|uniref:uncharacterized protein LOC143899742 isoform X1 n=1 Tax=Temnothorax americanus TaxID=1964332 RepID=UPI0040694FFF